jgi:hypothetical protein
MPLFFHQKQKKETEEYQKGLKRPRHHGNFILDVVLRANVTEPSWQHRPWQNSRMTVICVFYGKILFFILEFSELFNRISFKAILQKIKPKEPLDKLLFQNVAPQ